jgi:sugar lactone lactonase YvrE
MNVRKPSTTPAIVADYSCLVASSPLWHSEEKRLYWVDAPRGRLFRHNPGSGTHEQIYQGGSLGGLAVQADGSVLLVMESGAVKVWRETGILTVTESLTDREGFRIGGVVADPAGRVVFSALPTGPTAPGGPGSPAGGRSGTCYRLDPDGTVARLFEGISSLGGASFTPDGRGLYCVGHHRRAISLFEYDPTAGALSNPQVFVTFPESLGVPRGVAVDAKGFVWAAVQGGSCVMRFSPAGKEEQRVYFPAALVVGVAFGGEDFRDLYVTTAGGDNKKENGPGAGALYRVRPGIRGVAGFHSRVGM